MSEFSQLRARLGLSVGEISEFLGVSERTGYRYENGESAPRIREVQAMRGLLFAGVQGHLQFPAPEAASPFTFVDLFAGIGGMRRGFESIGGKCIFTSEWDSFSQATYTANYPVHHPLEGDITRIPDDAIPGHDVLLAGFPCQPFSLAGVSKKNSLGRPHGFQCDVQGTLFFDVARIIRHHRPRAFLLENVKNLKSHDRGRTFEVIMTTLRKDLGYQVQTRVIDARSFVPQHRERIFMVGFRDRNDFDLQSLQLPDPARGPRLSSILHPEDGSEKPEARFIAGPRGTVLDRYTLSDHLWGYLQTYAEKHREKGNGFGFGLVRGADVARTLSARYHKDGSEILVAQARKNPRRLTPRECARLMGFDVPTGQEFRIPVSDTQAYRQFGNAVVVPVVKAIAQHMSAYIRADRAAASRQERAVA